MMKRKWIISGVLTFIILLAGMSAYQVLRKQKEPVAILNQEEQKLREVDMQQFIPAMTDHSIDIDGRLVAFEQVNLYANVSGILHSTGTTIKKGTYVRKGDLLFDVDNRKAVHSLHAMRSSLLNAITLVMPDLKVDHAQAYPNWKEYLDQFQIEKQTLPLPTAVDEQEKYFIASKNLYQLYYNIKGAEASLKDYHIFAPFSGEIVQAGPYPGTLVNPGQLLGTMINTSQFELEATITESDLQYVKSGNKAELVSEVSGLKWPAQVARIGSQIDPLTQKIPVYLKVSGKGLKNGMYLNGKISAKPIENVVKIDRSLLVNQKYVYTVRDSTIGLCEIDIIKEDERYVYVAGHNPNTWVIGSSTDGLYAGQKVIPKMKMD